MVMLAPPAASITQFSPRVESLILIVKAYPEVALEVLVMVEKDDRSAAGTNPGIGPPSESGDA